MAWLYLEADQIGSEGAMSTREQVSERAQVVFCLAVNMMAVMTNGVLAIAGRLDVEQMSLSRCYSLCRFIAHLILRFGGHWVRSGGKRGGSVGGRENANRTIPW